MKRKKHFVLIDDDIMTSRIHQSIIRKQHAEKELVLFEHAGIAFDYIRHNLPDLIFLDLHMPIVDGLQFLKLMDDHKICADVIVVSSSTDPDERSLLKSYDFVRGFITKPLTAEKLKMMLERTEKYSEI